MKAKPYYTVYTYINAAMALLPFFVVLFFETDQFGFIFSLILCPIFAYKSYSCFIKAKQAREEDRVYAPPADAKTNEQIAYYKRILWLALAFPVLGILTYFDLNDLEHGESASLLAPIAFIYDKFGYWTAVFFTPTLGILVVILFFRKIRQLKKESSNH